MREGRDRAAGHHRREHGLSRKPRPVADRQAGRPRPLPRRVVRLAGLGHVAEGAALTPSQLVYAKNVARLLDDAPPGPDDRARPRPPAPPTPTAPAPASSSRSTEGGWETFRGRDPGVQHGSRPTCWAGSSTVPAPGVSPPLLEIVIAGLDCRRALSRPVSRGPASRGGAKGCRAQALEQGPAAPRREWPGPCRAGRNGGQPSSGNEMAISRAEESGESEPWTMFCWTFRPQSRQQYDNCQGLQNIMYCL